MVYYLLTGEGCMAFEFDEAKSLWTDSLRLQLPGRWIDEQRFLVIGLIGERMWTAAVTYRGERVRLIPVRRARRAEVRAYGDQR